MTQKKSFDFFDILVLLIESSKFFILLFFGSVFLGYAGIYLFVQNQYEASATIISVEEQSSGLMANVLRSFDGLPFGVGGGTSRTQTEKFNTIIYSRTAMEGVLARFNLYGTYGLDSSSVFERELAVKKLRKTVVTNLTNESAFEIKCSAESPQLAADITNYFVELLNREIISLNIDKSRENRQFLEQRVSEIKVQLKMSEDSLTAFQERSGMLEVTSQLKEILAVYSSLENELITKQLQRSILENIYGKDSPQAINAAMEIREYERKLDELNSRREPGSVVLAMKSLPKTAAEYLRLYRSVEINNQLLKFVLPLFEQAKIDEKKDSPILQVIDKAIPPGRRSYPPRTVFSVSIAMFVVLGMLFFRLLQNRFRESTNPKIEFLRTHLRIFRKQKD